MTWKNAFDDGPCRVVVESDYGRPYVYKFLDATMAKGDSATVGGVNGLPIIGDINVSLDGVVSMAGDQFSFSNCQLTVRVIPVSIPADAACRVRTISVNAGASGMSYAAAFAGYTDAPVSKTELLPVGPLPINGWTPDPCVLTAPVSEMSIDARTSFGG